MTHSGQYSLVLNYPTSAENEPRWGYGKPTHPLLYEIFNRGRHTYADLLTRFLAFKEKYRLIPVNESRHNPKEPYLSNLWFPGLDSFTLYCLLAMRRPKRYIEIGSGHSTKFARRSIRDNLLNTRLISIDPEPRAEINELCDEVYRQPLEQLDISFFEQLEEGDFLFFDGSHRSFMNSDVTVFFLDILPRLSAGVVVHIHDICLPNDYLPGWCARYYNEQYLLAAYLLSGNSGFDILLPNAFVSGDTDLLSIVAPVFSSSGMEQVIKGGGSFWLVTRSQPFSSIHHEAHSMTSRPVARDDELAEMRKQLSKLQVGKQVLLADYALARQTLIEISNSRAYRLLRRLGRWKWLEGVIAQLPMRRTADVSDAKEQIQHIPAARTISAPQPGGLHVGFRELLRSLRARGLNCTCIFDVGANHGGWSKLARDVFPESRFVLVEPQVEMEVHLQAFCRESPHSRYYIAGAGAEAGQLTLTIWNDLAGSSFLPAQSQELLNAGKQRAVPIITLNSLLENESNPMPQIVKLDVQGFELEVLKGATQLFGFTEVFILEVSLFEFLNGQPIFGEVIAYMAQNGYVVYDLPECLRRPYDGALGQIDVCFTKRDGLLRASNRWQ